MEEKFMQIALLEAKKSQKRNEVPIGAVIVLNGKVVSKAHNTRNKTQNAINHAEVIAISKACKKLKSWRLDNCDIYVTLEPCPMCAGAILNARIKNLYFGAFDKTGNNNLLETIMTNNRLNHKTCFCGGIYENECSSILTNFFQKKREQ